MPLTARQEQVLRTVIEEYIASGAPVGSKHLSEHPGFGVAASTIRNDLADLEDLGMLAHPHTSAGRVPTDAGYRHYVDAVDHRAARGAARRPARARPCSQRDRRRAARDCRGALSRHRAHGRGVGAGGHDLHAAAHRDPLAAAAARHGGAHHHVGPGHEAGLLLRRPGGRGARRVRSRLSQRAAGRRAAGYAARDGRVREPGPAPQGTCLPRRRSRPAFETPGPGDVEGLHLGGTSRLLDNLTRAGAVHLSEVLQMLEERYNLLELLAGASCARTACICASATR